MNGRALHRIRAKVTWSIRLLAIVLCAVGVYLFLKRLAFAIGVNDVQAAFRSWKSTGEGHSAYRGIAMVIVGAALAAASKRIALWAICSPASGCPRCGYQDGQSRCSECGWTDPPVNH